MPNLPTPGDTPDSDIETKMSKKREDLWSPEFSEGQKTTIRNIAELNVPDDPDKEDRAGRVGRIIIDSSAHLKFRGVQMPENLVISPEVQDAIGYASAVVETVDVDNLQVAMKNRLDEQEVEVSPDLVDRLGEIALAYKIVSWRTTDGTGRDPYNQVEVARGVVDSIVATVGNQEGVISADDIIKELSTTKIRVGIEKVKKGKGKKPNKVTSAWENTSESSQELILMILTDAAGRLGGEMGIDERGKPFVTVGEGAVVPVERTDLGTETTSVEFEEKLKMYIDTGFIPLLEDQTEESLREDPIEIGGQVFNINENAEDFYVLTESEQEAYKKAVLEAARQIFPNVVLEETEEGLFLTIK